MNIDFYVCPTCWEHLKVVPNLVQVGFRHISKMNVKCNECGCMTTNPVGVRVSNERIDK